MPRFDGIPIDQKGPRFQGIPLEDYRAKLSREMEHKAKPDTSRETRATKDLPELGQGGLLHGEDPAKVMAIAPILLTTMDPKEISAIVHNTFPHIGQVQDEKGNEILANNKTGAQVVINKPGLSQLDMLQGIGLIAAFTPSSAIATLGTEGAKAGLKMAGQRALQGGAAAAGTMAAMEGAQKAAGGDFSGANIGLAGALQGGAELVGPAVQGFRQARQAHQLGIQGAELADVRPALEQARAAQAGLEKVTGINPRLFQAQQMAVPSKLEEQSFVGMLPAGSRVARRQLLAQNKEAAQTVDKVLNMIAPSESVQTGAGKVRSIAQQSLDALKTIRKDRTSPIYNSAFRTGVKVDVSPILKELTDITKEYPKGGEVQRTLAKISNYLSVNGNPTLRQLHNAKLEIDQMIAKYGENSLGNTTKAIVLDVKNKLLTAMDNASPMYAEARKEFTRLSPSVENYQNSILGRIANLKDPQLKNVSKSLFDASETNPAVIANSKKIVESVDPQAWREITRVELERRLGVMRGDLQLSAEGANASIENLPGQLQRAIFGNAKQRQVLYAGAPTDVKKTLRYLETYLNRAKLGRPGGSQTATREEVKKRLGRGWISSLWNYFTHPLETVRGIGQDVSFDRKARVLSEALFDPKWEPKVAELRSFNPNTPAAAKAMAQLLREVDMSHGTKQ